MKIERLFAIGIDVGSSSIRLLLVNKQGDVLREEKLTFNELEKQGCHVWDEEKKIDAELLFEIIIDMLAVLLKQFSGISIDAISITGFGPSLVFLDRKGRPIGRSLTYAYQGAEEYLPHLEDDFQMKTGGLYSASLPIVQLIQIRDRNEYKGFSKITTVNDYLAWRMTGKPVEEIFSSIPNASYTGLYSVKTRDWDKDQLERVGLSRISLPRIIPLGTRFSVAEKWIQRFPILKGALVVVGTIDGIDTFWATSVKHGDKVLVGSASTTGALRRWQEGPSSRFNSRLVLCCHVVGDDWVEIIPFNNVGTSLNWLARMFQKGFEEYLKENKLLNLELLEKIATKRIKDINDKKYLTKIPIFFPYIEGEPRGPNGRGKKIKGGFVNGKEEQSAIDLYIALILGIVNLYRHNLELLSPRNEYKEIRLTGQVARKSYLFCNLLSTSIMKDVVIMKKEQSVAWATAMRALVFIKAIPEFPKVKTLKTFEPVKGEIKNTLDEIYQMYRKIYEKPNEYGMKEL
ncbi:MAG: xylulokinase [Candidatus Hodarchaeales archaeon]|jgi:xylulokinase